MSAKNSTSYTFDYEHRLKTIGSTIQYFYDGMGKRVRAVRSGVTTKYIYDARGNLLAEADSNNVIQRYYIYGNGLMAKVTASENTYCYHYNATGSTIAITDSSQSIVNKYAYTPFGEIGNEVEALAQPFKYIGQYGVMSESNGLYYMRARYYDPTLGRFISEDPLGFGAGDVNLYVYVNNNPVLLIDPSGSAGFALDFGGAYGSGWGTSNYSTGGGAGSGIFVGVRPDSMGHAQLGGFICQSYTDTIPGAKVGLGVNLTYYKGDSRDFLSGVSNYTSLTFAGVSVTKYSDQKTEETTGWTVSLFGKGIGFTGFKEGTTQSWSGALQK
ncbi:MAG: RHS repeat-associated core domain-containing protein [Desulfatiglans sp.]|nr:RHS repeat-associated core domain-containing protein [Desulfatiglans sp.]